MEKLEIERRFLVKKSQVFDLFDDLLNQENAELHSIFQIYIKENTKQIIRYRSDCLFGKKKVINTHFKTQKKFISSGIFEEKEQKISTTKFYKVIGESKIDRLLFKTRIKIPYKNLIFEFDFFDPMGNMCILEVELKNIKQKITFLPLLKKFKLTEITGKKKYSNYSLAKIV